jgi:hypothetical protein
MMFCDTIGPVGIKTAAPAVDALTVCALTEQDPNPAMKNAARTATNFIG